MDGASQRSRTDLAGGRLTLYAIADGLQWLDWPGPYERYRGLATLAYWNPSGLRSSAADRISSQSARRRQQDRMFVLPLCGPHQPPRRNSTRQRLYELPPHAGEANGRDRTAQRSGAT